MTKGTEIFINCKGLVTPSQRNADDGFVYFGNVDESSNKDQVDFEIPIPKATENNDNTNV